MNGKAGGVRESSAVRDGGPGTDVLRGQFAELRLRLIVASMMRVAGGLAELGTIPALVDQLNEWADGIVSAQRLLAELYPSKQPARDPSDTGPGGAGR